MKIQSLKLLALLILVCFYSNYLNAIPNSESIRNKQDFNDNWKFILDDNPDYASEGWDDSSWRSLNLPHDWSIEGDFSAELTGRNAWLPAGIGWYRKTFEVPVSEKGKHIEIQFDGVYKNAEIWLNNFPVGVQHDGYTSFYFDISEFIRYGEKNVMAVRVDNSIQPNCRWYSGSGIYRNVWLTTTSPTHVKNWGTYITTPVVTDDEALVKVVTTIENFDEPKTVELLTQIFNSEDEMVALTSSAVNVGRFCEIDVTHNVSVKNPELWSLDQSNKYSVVSIVKSGSGIIDQYNSDFGIRTIRFDAQKGFFLNGENIKMKGVCLHHDAGPLGAAVPDGVWERRLKNLKTIGCNAIRTAHNPPSPEFLDLCDKLGFLVMDEFVDKWEKLYQKQKDRKNPYYDVPFNDPNFAMEWQKNFSETIRRDRNHPSVIIWSVGNENHQPGSLGQNNGLRTYASFVRSMDPTRPVISGMERGKDKAVAQKVDDIIESCKYMDLIALNYGEQWCKLIDERNPGKPYVSTESYTYFNSELEKRFAQIARCPWLDVLDNEFNMGLFIWVGVNYLGEAKNFPSTGSGSGLFDYAGFRTYRSYLWEAFWNENPVVNIGVYHQRVKDYKNRGGWGFPLTTHNWNREKGDIIDLVTYTNCESVELYLNNEKIGCKNLADYPNWIMDWTNVIYKPGTLKAVGFIDGKPVCEHILKTTGPVRNILLNADVDEIKPNQIIHVEIQLTDKKGKPVTHSEKELHFSLEGDAEIIGIHNGKETCVVSNSNLTNRNTHLGRCLCIIKTNKVAQTFNLKVSADGPITAVLKK